MLLSRHAAFEILGELARLHNTKIVRHISAPMLRPVIMWAKRLTRTEWNQIYKASPASLGLDRGNFDMVIGFAGELRALRNIGTAVLASVRHDVATRCRVRVRPAMRAGVRLALAIGRAVLDLFFWVSRR
jgi:hypothetical protein